MSRPLRLAPPTTTLHVYRHLLREASYLPSVVRPFIDDQIRLRFHKCQKDPRHAESRTKKAHSSLRYLRAANGGDISRMNRILLFAFGRIGPRRHDLMAKLVRRPIPRNTEELAAYVKETSEVSSLDRDPDWLDNWDTQKLASLARSQIAASPPNSPRPDITDAMVNLKSIPELNSWGEPWNPKTYRTKLKKFWKNLAHRVLAPLPQKEWQMLSLLAQGCFSEVGWKVPARRTPVGGPYEEGWRWSLYSTQPVARVDRDSSRRFKLLTGARDDNTPTGDPQPLNFQKLTPRLWKRLFMKIWRLSPTVEKVASGQSGSRWEVKWERDNFQPPIAQTAGEMEFFSGIDEEELRPRKVNSGKLRKGKKIV